MKLLIIALSALLQVNAVPFDPLPYGRMASDVQMDMIQHMEEAYGKYASLKGKFLYWLEAYLPKRNAVGGYGVVGYDAEPDVATGFHRRRYRPQYYPRYRQYYPHYRQYYPHYRQYYPREEPVFMGLEPVFMGEEPVVMGRRPVVVGRRPVVMGRRPVVVGRRPVVMGRRPVVVGRRPVVMGRRPVVVGRRPVVMGRRPLVMGYIYGVREPHWCC
eukprot:GHVR01123239.1.p1 GENE.GHVR01123239.1~~GHVR01123239.1.p1  ORF type:complete len:215 (+),score=-0.41 GHVR01123239.1:45-689(+)